MDGVYFENNEVTVKYTTRLVNVPDNDIARLMYYLNCVLVAIEMEQDSDVRRFENYDNWADLSLDEQKMLLTFCQTFSPDILENKVFFENADLCRNTLNEFIEISQVHQQLLAAESIIIAGQTREVNKIMVYERAWMDIYYWRPMRELAQQIRLLERPVITYTLPSTSTYSSTFRSTPVLQQPPTKSHCCNKPCVFGFCCGLLIVLVAIIALIVYFKLK